MRILYKSMEGAQGNREAEVFQVSNDDTAVAQRRLEEKQPEEKTNKGLLEVYTTMYEECGRQQFGDLLQGLQQQHGGYNQVYISSEWVTIISDWIQEAYRYVGGFGWLASIKQGMLERLRNTGFNESGEYKKTFIGSSVGTSSMKVLHGFKFEVEPLRDHTFEVEPRENVDQGAEDINEAAFAVAAVEKIYAHKSLTFNNTIAYELITKWKAGLKDNMDARSDVYVLSNGCRKSSDDGHDYYWECAPEIIRDQSGTTLRVSQSKIHNEKLVQTLLEGHSILSLEDSLSEDCDVEKNASVSVDMLDGFDHGLQTNVQVFVDFDYVMGRSIAVMSRSITRYGLMILGCAGSLKANFQNIEAFSTTKARYMTFTEVRKKKIWQKGLLTKS
ncbi:hypothetical protein Tco_1433533 [Tanacetum coccineum]